MIDIEKKIKTIEASIEEANRFIKKANSAIMRLHIESQQKWPAAGTK